MESMGRPPEISLHQRHESKARLLVAAIRTFRATGYAATTIDDVCAAAGCTKGSFFHHFDSKEDLALSAIDVFAEEAELLFAAAAFHDASDPVDRVLGYVDFRGTLLAGELPEFTCLLGTLLQEMYASHPAIRTACDARLSEHVEMLSRDLRLARQTCASEPAWSAASVGNFIQAVLQGSFILAKARGSPAVVRENLSHLRRYLESILRFSQ
jgi:TetR/AcrR family transcriptional regulator, transcriptional repressor for nem operon